MKRMGIMFMFALGLSSLQAQSSKCFKVFNQSARVALGSTAEAQFAKAIVSNNVQVAQKALEAGADKDAKIIVQEITPNQVAQFMAKNNQKDNELIQHHLSEVVSVMRVDNAIGPVTTKVTPLVLAHALGHKEMVEFLTKKQAKFSINDAEININQLKTSYGREALKPILADHSKNQRVLATSFVASGVGMISFIVFPFMGGFVDSFMNSIAPAGMGEKEIGRTVFTLAGIAGGAVAVIGFFPLLTSIINSFYHDRKLKEANELKFVNGRYKDVGEGVEVAE